MGAEVTYDFTDLGMDGDVDVEAYARHNVKIAFEAFAGEGGWIVYDGALEWSAVNADYWGDAFPVEISLTPAEFEEAMLAERYVDDPDEQRETARQWKAAIDRIWAKLNP